MDCHLPNTLQVAEKLEQMTALLAESLNRQYNYE